MGSLARLSTLGTTDYNQRVKNRVRLLLLLGASAAMLVLYRLGTRSLTILRNDAPAAGATIQRLGPKGVEELVLDENGALQLPWGLWEPHPMFLFRAAADRNYQMQLPQMGHRTYQVWDYGLT
ncbi:MAG: hypothetical protein VYD05_02580, partial [Planctomycetota bacterium]|nr:hypothetical protein [Planctomycetota bacterium]